MLLKCEVKTYYNRSSQEMEGPKTQSIKSMNLPGQPLTSAECRELIASADKDEDNCMSFFEFVIMVKAEQKTLGDDDQSLREAFNLFDTNGV